MSSYDSVMKHKKKKELLAAHGPRVYEWPETTIMINDMSDTTKYSSVQIRHWLAEQRYEIWKKMHPSDREDHFDNLEETERE